MGLLLSRCGGFDSRRGRSLLRIGLVFARIGDTDRTVQFRNRAREWFVLAFIGMLLLGDFCWGKTRRREMLVQLQHQLIDRQSRAMVSACFFMTQCRTLLTTATRELRP